MEEPDPRDKALRQLIRGIFSEHPRLKNLPIAITVKGAVAHITGTVASPEEKELVRNHAGRIRGIVGVWDMLGRANEKPPVILDLGCGTKKQAPTAIGVDRHAYRGIDINADLEKPLPFKTGSADYIFAVHCLEHIHNLIAVMNEIHRVLAPRGAAHIMVPLAQSPNSVADPTHVRFFNRQTFKYFCLQRPGLLPFKPIQVSVTADTVLADLCPVKQGESLATAEELALYFD